MPWMGLTMMGSGVDAGPPRSTTKLPLLPVPGVHERFTEPLVLGEETTTLEGPDAIVTELTLVPLSSKSVKNTWGEAVLNMACAMPTCSGTPARSVRVKTPPAGRLFVI